MELIVLGEVPGTSIHITFMWVPAIALGLVVLVEVRRGIYYLKKRLAKNKHKTVLVSQPQA